jgi:hypothetical protein
MVSFLLATDQEKPGKSTRNLPGILRVPGNFLLFSGPQIAELAVAGDLPVAAIAGT